MKEIIRNLLFFAVLVVILIIAILGLPTAKNTLVMPIGTMQISSFENGISLFQNNKGKFYAFSPFNDYYVENDIRKSLITVEEIEARSYSHNLNNNNFEKLFEMGEAYFRLDTPSIEFNAANKIRYDTKLNGNSLIITKNASGIDSNNPTIQAFTIPFYSSDFVFDNEFNLYSYIPDRQLNLFELIYNKKFSSLLEELEITVPGKTLYIYNTQISGVIMVKATNSQTIKINRNAKLVEIEENISPKDGIYTQQLQIEILNSPRQI